MTKGQEVKAALEKLAGREISPGVPLDVINLFSYLGTGVGTIPPTPAATESFTTWRSLILGAQTETSDSPLLDLTGFSATGSDGNSVFQLATFTGGFQIDPQKPINVVATARGGSPASLTVEYAPQASDVEITVHAWDPQGNPAPNVMFDWRCRVAFVEE